MFTDQIFDAPSYKTDGENVFKNKKKLESAICPLLQPLSEDMKKLYIINIEMNEIKYEFRYPPNPY